MRVNGNLNNLDLVAKHKERSNKYLKQVQQSMLTTASFDFKNQKEFCHYLRIRQQN